MKKLKIGQIVTFDAHNVHFRGVVTCITGEMCYVAVLGYPDTFRMFVIQAQPVVHTSERFASL